MDFVYFNLAMKLKDKGFDVPCIYAYCEKGGWNMYTQKHEPITYVLRTDGNPFGSYYVGENWNKEYKTNKNKIQCSAPTISQVLKWLRDEFSFHISTKPYLCEDGLMWIFEVRKFNTHIIFVVANKKGFAEEKLATLAGIEYVLNLI